MSVIFKSLLKRAKEELETAFIEGLANEDTNTVIFEIAIEQAMTLPIDSVINVVVWFPDFLTYSTNVGHTNALGILREALAHKLEEELFAYKREIDSLMVQERAKFPLYS
jgi:hypothetical protein